VNGNQPGLFARGKDLPWAKIRPASTVEARHGRRARRTIKVAAAPALLDFAGAVQVAQIRRTRTIAGKKTVEVVYVTYDQDRSCVRTGSAPRVMASLRSTAISVLRLKHDSAGALPVDPRAAMVSRSSRTHGEEPPAPQEASGL
jgi:hypothetical protein